MMGTQYYVFFSAQPSLCCHQRQKPGCKKPAIEINVIQTIEICRSQLVPLYGKTSKGADYYILIHVKKSWLSCPTIRA